GRVALGVGALSVTVAAAIGLTLGVLLRSLPTSQQRVGAVVDRALVTLTAFPGLLVALAVVAALHPGFTSLVVSFTLTQVPTFMRVGMTLARARTRESGAPSSVGRGPFNPNALGLLLAQVPLSMALVIVGESTLSWLGLGMRPPSFDWGLMMSDALGR